MGLLLAVEGDAPLPKNLHSDGTIIVGDRLTLGRAEDNDLVLDDQQDNVATHHCMIYSDQGRYQVLDHSGGGTIMNEAAHPMASDGPVTLATGDCLQIGAFRLTVMGTSKRESLDAVLDDAPATDDAPDVDPEPPEPQLLERVLMAEDEADYVVRPDDRESPWDDDNDALFPEKGGLSQADHLDPIHEAYVTPQRGTEMIPDDWDLMAELDQFAPPPPQVEQPAIRMADPAQPAPGVPPAPRPSAPPPPQQQAATPAPRMAASDAGIAAFCRGAGIDPADLPPGQEAQTMELAGQILSTALTGLHMLLADCVRHGPGFNASGNGIPGSEMTNPLSLPGTSRDTLRLLLRGSLPGIMPGDAAIARACAEIAEQKEGLVGRLRQTAAAVTQTLAPDAIAETMDAPSFSDKLRRVGGGPEPFRRAYERRHREVAAGVRVLAGQSAGGADAGSRHDD